MNVTYATVRRSLLRAPRCANRLVALVRAAFLRLSVSFPNGALILFRISMHFASIYCNVFKRRLVSFLDDCMNYTFLSRSSAMFEAYEDRAAFDFGPRKPRDATRDALAAKRRRTGGQRLATKARFRHGTASKVSGIHSRAGR